ncbi:MAG: hypothetical protein H7039_01020, partial [Bryobacteraceae bacterium]|nr:hypothetical protein [Bryobacteraceae bacterium]
MKSIDAARTARFLSDLDRLDARQLKVQREISSGFRVNSPSDSPEQMIDILQLRSDVERASSVDQNLGRVESEVNTAEATVRVATQLLERARTLAAQTATDTATNRPGIALEVKQIHQQLVDITRTMSEGRFVFSGDSDSAPSYSVDWTVPGGMTRLQVTTNTRQVLDVNGTSFSVARTAGQIFDTREVDDSFSTNNVFNAVYQLGVALESDDVTAVRSAAALINV